MVSIKAFEAFKRSTNGSYESYLEEWHQNSYDPTKDPTILTPESGGTCTANWALSLEQVKAVNKIWYGPTKNGEIPDPESNNGAGWKLSDGQVWWGKIRGTKIEFAGQPRDIGGGFLPNVFDPKLASPLWNHPLGKSENSWRTFFTRAIRTGNAERSADGCQL